MIKLKIACYLLGITMLLIVVFFQVIKPLSPQEEWDTVNSEMAGTLQLESNSHVGDPKKLLDHVVDTTKQQSDKPALTDNISETESHTKIEAHEPPQSSIINLNTATLEELDVLPGIGPSKAKAIIDYRTKYGDFRSLEQIMEVKGIGPKLFEKMKERITITTQS